MIKQLLKYIDISKNLTVFIDMDGVLARYERHAYDRNNGPAPNTALFEHKASHYFRHCKPDEKAIALLNALTEYKNIRIYILSTVAEHIPWAAQDKKQWLFQNCPKIDPDTQLIIASTDKAEIIKAMEKIDSLNSKMILIDDFNRNLQLWKSENGLAIKYLNGINSHNSWDGPVIF